MDKLGERRQRNIRFSIVAVKDRLALPVGAHDKKCVLVCYGPSLQDTFNDIDVSGHVVTVSAAHDYIVKRDIMPDFHVEFDGRKHKAKHIRLASSDVTYYLASCVHPEVVKSLTWHKVKLWHAKQLDINNALIASLEPEAYLIEGGSSVGLRAIELFYALGYRDFYIHGMDSSFRDDGRRQWAGPHFGRSRHKRDIADAECAGRRFKSSIAFVRYAREFMVCQRKLHDARMTLFGDGLLQHMIRSQVREIAA